MILHHKNGEVTNKRNAGQFASFEENKRQNNKDNNIANNDDS